ncbi:MAG: hypothetical protein HN790_09750 [Methylococcales bacterium]|nr:hypothetical protein [Methylococcales bacterium]
MKKVTILAPGLLQGISGWQDYPKLWPNVPILQSYLSKSLAHVCVDKTADEFISSAAEQAVLPIAPISFLADKGKPEAKRWLRLDPVFFQLDRDCVWVQGLADNPLSAAESDTLYQLCEPVLNERGFTLLQVSIGRWYVEISDQSDIEVVSLQEAFGSSADEVMPTGEDALLWRQIMNELQMLLYQHPINIAREELGHCLVNAFWPWGIGHLPSRVVLPYRHIFSYDVFFEGLALLGGCEAKPLSSATQQPHFDDSLIVLPHSGKGMMMEQWCAQLSDFEHTWLTPLLAQLTQGKLDELWLYPCSGQAYQLTRLGLKKFWRRNKPLHHFTEV